MLILPEKATAVEMLDLLNEFFRHPPYGSPSYESGQRFQQEDLWIVLTALRGPDVGIYATEQAIRDVKANTTEIIRKAAFPGGWLPGACVSDSTLLPINYRSQAESCGLHFANHISSAVDVLVRMKRIQVAMDYTKPNAHSAP